MLHKIIVVVNKLADFQMLLCLSSVLFCIFAISELKEVQLQAVLSLELLHCLIRLLCYHLYHHHATSSCFLCKYSRVYISALNFQLQTSMCRHEL